MANGDSKICEKIKQQLQTANILEEEKLIQHATKFACRNGVAKAAIVVFNTGRMNVEGSDSELKKWLISLKESIEKGSGAPGVLLPDSIEKLPQTLKERVPACDGVIIWYFTEALRCYKVGSVAGASFMLGAASEKAIYLLIECYISRISDDENRKKIEARTSTQMISRKYDEFKKSYKSAKPKPADALAQDLEQLLDGAFNFYRHTRNHVGHPQVIPDLDPGVVLASIGQFVTYMERIYALMAFFAKNEIVT